MANPHRNACINTKGSTHFVPVARCFYYLCRHKMEPRSNIKSTMNSLGSSGEPFTFLVNFDGTEGYVFPANDSTKLRWKTQKAQNYSLKTETIQIKKWETTPVDFMRYKKGFDTIQKHIENGDTYLLNYTQETQIETNLTLETLFHGCDARYKIWLPNRFVCFSPETFVQITQGKIASFPMKGTINANLENAQQKLLQDVKERAEHNTIVDLIRNDLSRVAENVTVEKFRYLERIKTHQTDLWQMSSKITGDLPPDYTANIGNIIFSMLPAGSVSGAPKNKTCQIIRAAENYDRGYYTGVFGYFDGKDLDSCVLIRFIENQNGKLVYKSGGGITFMSKAKTEYEEMLNKVYVPISN